jgi:lysozyme family protein
MRSRFIDLVEGVLDREGGYVDHRDDPGGCTNMGITIGTLGDWRGEKVTCDDVRALTRDEAKEIYHSRYWSAVRANAMPPGVDVMLFDFAVNAGPGRAAKILQTLLRKRDATLKVDGAIGPRTLAAVKKASARALIDEFHAEKMRFYRGLGTWNTFGKGWAARADAVLAEARSVV